MTIVEPFLKKSAEWKLVVFSKLFAGWLSKPPNRKPNSIKKGLPTFDRDTQSGAQFV